jgi:hypothetical protein
MRGYDLFNFNAFELGHIYLSFVLGHDVISPHQVDIDHGGVEVQYEYRSLDLTGTSVGAYIPYRHFTDVRWVDEAPAGTDDAFAICMRRDIPIVAGVDAVSFLPGWERSTGSKVEAQVARWCGRALYEHSPFLYFRDADPAIVDALTLAVVA